MDNMKQSLEHNARLLKTKVSKYAWLGLSIALLTIIIGTLAVCYQMTGAISIEGLVHAQRSNIALMILDLTPFIFMLWGQSVSSVMSYTAGAMVIDQTQKLRSQTNEITSKAEHEASHDLLTNLPNRALYVDRLRQAITSRRGKAGMLAVIIININDFKELNTGFGNFNADRLLKQFSQRLQYVIKEPATVARFGADEFAVLFPHIDKIEEVVQYVKTLQKNLDISFALDSVTFDVKASMGITLYPKHGQDQDTLIQRASIALYHAKQISKPYAIYEQSMDKECPNKLIMMSELKRAIESEQLIMNLQPKVSLKDNMVSGCEALLCWEHPTFGLMTADKFIPVAERTGLIKPITQLALKQSISHAAQWYKKGKHIGVAINLSAIDIMDTELPYTVESLLNVFDFPPSLLTLEVTESFHLHDHHRSKEVIKRLEDIGVRVCLDDFGTGYSTFYCLTTLPVNELKIDKSFIEKIEEDDKIFNIVKAIIELGRASNINIVAEGVERIQQQKILVELGCNDGQGYFYSKPIRPDRFEDIIMASQKLPAHSGDDPKVSPLQLVEKNRA